MTKSEHSRGRWCSGGGSGLAVAALGLLAAALLGGCRENVSDKDIELVTVAQVRAVTTSTKDTGTLIVDPRSAEEYAERHIPTAENWPLQTVPDKRDSLDSRLKGYKLLIVYGMDPGSGVAKAMVKRLLTGGAKDAKWYSGGLMDWVQSGYPVEKGPDKRFK